jgi:hypothetical protein
LEREIKIVKKEIESQRLFFESLFIILRDQAISIIIFNYIHHDSIKSNYFLRWCFLSILSIVETMG